MLPFELALEEFFGVDLGGEEDVEDIEGVDIFSLDDEFLAGVGGPGRL